MLGENRVSKLQMRKEYFPLLDLFEEAKNEPELTSTKIYLYSSFSCYAIYFSTILQFRSVAIGTGNATNSTSK